MWIRDLVQRLLLQKMFRSGQHCPIKKLWTNLYYNVPAHTLGTLVPLRHPSAKSHLSPQVCKVIKFLRVREKFSLPQGHPLHSLKINKISIFSRKPNQESREAVSVQALTDSPALLAQLGSFPQTPELKTDANLKEMLPGSRPRPLNHHHFLAGWPHLQNQHLFAQRFFWLWSPVWPAGGQHLPSTYPAVLNQWPPGVRQTP